MTKDEWIVLADVALQAAILTLRQEATFNTGEGRKRPHLTAVAEYLDTIREQRPKEG